MPLLLAVYSTATQAAPLVIGHRGFPALYPDHTLVGYEAAVRAGADYIEPDLVPTADGVLVARHENLLSDTTDADRLFPDRITTKTIDGESHTGVFSEDLSFDELRTLRARQPLDFRPHDHDGQHPVPTFDEVLALANRLQDELGRPVGVYPETKHPTWFDSQGLSLEEPMLASLEAAGRSQDGVFIQSFEGGNLRELDRATELPLVRLLPWDLVVGKRDVKRAAKYADGLGLHKSQVTPQVIAWAHDRGLVVHVYTFRSEAQYLGEGETAEQELRRFYAMGVDGVFADDTGVAVRAR